MGASDFDPDLSLLDTSIPTQPASGLTALLGPAEIRSLAERHGIRPTKTLGQNFMHDAGSIRKIVRFAGVKPGERVLEVGPGLGSLTLGLLEAGASVVVVEIDANLAAALPATIAKYWTFAPPADEVISIPNAGDKAGSPDSELTDSAPMFSELRGTRNSLELDQLVERPPLEVVVADAMKVQPADIPGPLPTMMVANLPYNVAVPILLNLLENFPSISSFTMLVQAEVADRIAAGPGSKVYGVPSAKVAWYGQARRGPMISRNVFWPVPNVDSALVQVVRHSADIVVPEEPVNSPFETSAGSRDSSKPLPSAPQPGINGPDESLIFSEGVRREQVFAVIDAAFAQRRKTLRQALAGLFGSASAAETALVRCGIDPSARGETLDISQFTAIAALLP